jgi:hypothetical protein
MGNQRTPGLQKRKGIWHIDKRFRGARICESTGTSDIQQTKEYFAKRVMEMREVRLFGIRQERTFRSAATKYLEENQHKQSLERDARALSALHPYIDDLPLRRVHHDTLQPYVRFRLSAGISPGTINRDLAVVRRILNLSARLWRDESDRPWLDTPPLIQLQRHPNKREPYRLSIEEQRDL